MLHDLLHRDLTKVNIRDVPPTDALKVQRAHSLDTFTAWWLDCLHRGYVFASKLGLEEYFAQWHPVVTNEVLYASYSTFAQARREPHPLSRDRFGNALVEIGGKGIRPRHCVVGEHLVGAAREPQLIIKDRAHGYRFGALATARAAFNAKTGLDIVWDKDAGKPPRPAKRSKKRDFRVVPGGKQEAEKTP